MISTLILICVCLQPTFSQSNQIELLDIKTDQIIYTVSSSSPIQSLVKNYVTGIDGIVKDFNPIPEEGMMVKVPLEPPVHVENEWINEIVTEVILIRPIDGAPSILIFNDENTPYFFTFSGELNTLFELIDFP